MSKIEIKFKILFFIFFHIQQNLLHTTIEPLPEYKTQSLKKSRFILSHYGVFKGFWDWLILVSTFYVAFVVPYNAAFVQADRATMASDVVVEALFIVGKFMKKKRFRIFLTVSDRKFLLIDFYFMYITRQFTSE